ncbi:MAG: hypothetical protein ACK56W_12900 [Pirellula sp.]|jgi:hypothetical protein|nr:hypothetical protein [Pirellula sp.]
MLEKAVEIVAEIGYFSLPIETMDGGWRRLVVAARKGSQGQLTGHSFWVCEIVGVDEWIVGTWGGNFYHASNFASFSRFVTDLFSIESDQILTSLPSRIVDEFAFTEISISRLNELVRTK